MKKLIIWIIILGAGLWAFDYFIASPEQNQLTEKALASFKGRIYIPPKEAPFEEFFMDQTGEVYKLDSKEVAEEIIKVIEEVKGASTFVEIKGKLKENPARPQEKEIIVKEVKQIIEKTEIKTEIKKETEFICPPCVCP